MRFATLLCWLATASLGAFMLRTWLVRGGLRRERERPGGLPPQLVFGHAALAVTGLLIWAGYLLAGPRALAWTAIALLMAAVGFGLATVTLWTPYPARRPGERRGGSGGTRGPHGRHGAPGDDGELVLAIPDTARTAARPAGHGDPADDGASTEFTVTDEMIARLLADPVPGRGGAARRIRPNPAVLIPVAHGFGAMATFVLAVMSAST